MSRFDRLTTAIVACLTAITVLMIIVASSAGIRIHVVEPGNDPGQIPVTASVKLRFNMPVNHDMAENAFSIVPSVDGVFRWQGQEMTFIPHTVLSPGVTYTVNLASGRLGQDGSELADDFTYSFVTRVPSILYLSDTTGDEPALWLWDEKTQSGRLVLAAAGGVRGFSPSPDGRRAAVTLSNDEDGTDVWIIEVNGKRREQITGCGADGCEAPAWSPDGMRIAYQQYSSVADDDGHLFTSSRLWLYELERGVNQPLYEDETIMGSQPVWSNDSRSLAGYDPVSGTVRVANLDTGESVTVESLGGKTGSLSPDGLKLAVEDLRRVGQQLYPEIHIAYLQVQGLLREMVREAQEDRSPAWSPDGRWIAFASRRLDRSNGMVNQLMLYDITEDSVHQITDDMIYNNTQFRWSPGGGMLLVQRYDISGDEASPELWIYVPASGLLTKLTDGAYAGNWLP